MGLSAEALREGLDALGRIEPRFRAAIDHVGYPEPRISKRGYATLLRTIVGQQVSFKAADAVWKKLETALGDMTDPAAITTSDFDQLRACGLSRQKQGYARSLAELVTSGELSFDALPEDDEDAIALLTKVKGIGR